MVDQAAFLSTRRRRSPPAKTSWDSRLVFLLLAALLLLAPLVRGGNRELAMSALLVYRHKLNIQRLLEGKESKLGQKKSK